MPALAPAAARSPVAAVMARALADVIRPPVPVRPSEWAAKHLIVPDGPFAGRLWNPQRTPYAIEILDGLDRESGATEIVVRKAEQTGLTQVGLAWIGHVACNDPGKMLVVFPGIDALKDFNSEKLQPTIDGTPPLRARIARQTSRSAEGSSIFTKKFPGGAILLGNANSAPDLSSKTVRDLFADEIDKWPDSVQDEGDPMTLAEGRQTSFLKARTSRRLKLSTPSIAGHSRIEAEFERSDKRFWTMPCPGCGADFVFRWSRETFRFERTAPYKAHYVTECCGTVIEEAERPAVVASGRWVATDPGPGKPRGYHVDQMISPFVPMDEIARRWWAAQGAEKKLQAFYNLTLGLPFELRGDAPDWERLLERREDYPSGRIPAAGLVVTAFADVQRNGLYVEIVAWGPGLRSWVVDAHFIAGDTTSATEGAFAELARLRERSFAVEGGGRRGIDIMGVDAGDGERCHVVYAFCRAREHTFATKGVGSWTAPAIGAPSDVDVTYGGRRIKDGCKLWPIGTWALKAQVYADLRKLGRAAGQEMDPPGYARFGRFLEPEYFRQLTSESLIDEKNKKTGVMRRIWRENGPNHYLDCRVGNLALAHHLRLDRMDESQWSDLAVQRGVASAALADLFAPVPPVPVTAAPVIDLAPEPAPVPPPAPRAPAGPGWIGRPGSWKL